MANICTIGTAMITIVFYFYRKKSNRKKKGKDNKKIKF